MSILIYDPYYPDPHMGGVQRMTYVMSKELVINGIDCIIGYGEKNTNFKIKDLKTVFLPKDKIASDLITIIKKYKITHIILQGYYCVLTEFYNILKDTNIKIIYFYHARPGWQLDCYDWNWLIRKRKFHKLPLNKIILQLLFWPLYKKYMILCQRRMFYNIENKSSCVVLLSEKFLPLYKNLVRSINTNKFRYIPNVLTLDNTINVSDINRKEKRVLIVSRMEEFPKNILEALNIWRQIENDSLFAKWHLDIVGDGPHIEIYKNYANKYLKRVIFYGKKNPTEFYLRSAIFMMTSSSEGWGLTLTESQQMGVVPIAFNSFESLSDIITNGQNGIIIDNGNSKQYVQELKNLMENESKRISLAKQGLKDSKKFKPDVVVQQWIKILNE